MQTLLYLSLVAAIFVAVIIALRSVRREQLRLVEEEMRRLGASPFRSGGAVMGSVSGIAVTYGFRETDRQGSETFCTALVPYDSPRLELELRPQTPIELRHVAAKRAVDLVFGDETFDDAFIVEAAPANIARALLDDPIRTALLTFHPCRVTVIAGELRFDKAAFLGEAGEIRRLLELCVSLCTRLTALSSAVEERQVELARVGDHAGYRGPSPDVIRSIDATLGGEIELAALAVARTRRHQWESWWGSVFVFTGIAIAAMAFWAYASGFAGYVMRHTGR